MSAVQKTKQSKKKELDYGKRVLIIDTRPIVKKKKKQSKNEQSHTHWSLVAVGRGLKGRGEEGEERKEGEEKEEGRRGGGKEGGGWGGGH